MKQKEEGLFILKAEIENFKNIDKRILEIDGKSFILVGKNGGGKSSMLQAILCGIDSDYIPTEPIKEGEKKGSTSVTLGGIVDGVETQYTLDVYFTPGNKKGRLVITDKDGAVVKASRTNFQEIIKYKAFNIYDFFKDTKANKVKALKNIAGVQVALDLIDIDKQQVYDERTAQNTLIKNDEAILATHNFTQDEIELYSATIDSEAIRTELAALTTKIDTITGFKTKVDGIKKQKEELLALSEKRKVRAKEAAKEIHALEEELRLLSISEDNGIIEADALETKIKTGETWLSANPIPSATEISERLSAADAHNEKFRQIEELGAKQIALTTKKKNVEKLTAQIDAFDKKKADTIKNSKLPVEGLTYDDNEVYLHGLPLEDGQQNTQSLLDLSFEISAALNPVLKTIFVHEGSLFDKAHLKAMVDKWEARGYRLIIEMVGDQEEVEMKFTEEIL